jgi:23S rRNA (guanosine2251-2'-O)-methyltransferase
VPLDTPGRREFRPKPLEEPVPDNKKKRGRWMPERAAAAPGLWLYGHHAVAAALANPKRAVKRLALTERAAEQLGKDLLGRVRPEMLNADAVSRLLPPGAVHQGVALECKPLPHRDLTDIAPAQDGRRRIVLVLDQISDPQNTGAILRSALAFGVTAVVVQDRHSAPESGALAKAASGALDVIPYITVVNISRTLKELSDEGFWRVGLTGDGDVPLREAVATGDIALVLGSEGTGLRRLVRENCDVAAYVPIETEMESLNVSNAAAVALYECRRG